MDPEEKRGDFSLEKEEAVGSLADSRTEPPGIRIFSFLFFFPRGTSLREAEEKQEERVGGTSPRTTRRPRIYRLYRVNDSRSALRRDRDHAIKSGERIDR